MLPIMPLSSTGLTSRGEPSTSSQRCASSRSPLRISLHCSSSTVGIYHASSHLASANGLPPSLAQRFMSDSPYRSCSACAAIVAPPCTERDASAADSLSSDANSPTSPELRMKLPPAGAFAPSTSSEKIVVREPVRLSVCMVDCLDDPDVPVTAASQ